MSIFQKPKIQQQKSHIPRTEKDIQNKRRKIDRNFILLSLINGLIGCIIVTITNYDFTDSQICLLGTILIIPSALYYSTKNQQLTDELKQLHNNETSNCTETQS